MNTDDGEGHRPWMCEMFGRVQRTMEQVGRKTLLPLIPSQCHRNAQSPHCATVGILRAGVLEPAAIIGHKVAKSAGLAIECIAQKAQINAGQVAWRGVQRLEVLCRDSDDQRAGIVVHTITMRPIRNRVLGMLEHTRAIGHAAQMIQFDFR